MLPNAESVAIAMVLILGAIVAWDAWWLTRQHRDIPEFGHLPNNGFAWKSERNDEMFRQWANLGSMAAMMALPWGFAPFLIPLFSMSFFGMYCLVCISSPSRS